MSTDGVITAERYSQGFTYEDYLGQLGDTKQRFVEHESAFHLAQLMPSFSMI